MSELSDKNSLDPRIRRTRKRVCDAMSQLLQEKSFTDISITDLTKRADVARVTFYQHFDNKETVLLMIVRDFFEQTHQLLDPLALQRFVETGKFETVVEGRPAPSADSTQLHDLHVALKHIGSDVRSIAVDSFLKAYQKRDFEGNELEIRVLATYHISGVLSLLESFLDDNLAVSSTAFPKVTLVFMRAILVNVLENGVLKEILGEE